MSNIDYTLWPNANGNLGEIKVQIPDGVTTNWPEGDALVDNFVYDNCKLVGFVDTKALIANSSKTSTLPYDYVNISLPSITKEEMTFTRGERCKFASITYSNGETEEMFKYKGCKTVADVRSVENNYESTDIVDGTWIEPLKDLENGNSNGENDGGMFYSANLSEFASDLSSLTNGHGMFANCPNLQSFNSDLSALTDGTNMFHVCSNLESFNSDLNSLENGEFMFNGCYNLQSFNSDLSALTNGYVMFSNCHNLTTFNSDLSSLENGESMFNGCSNLESFNSDLNALTNGTGMFYNCYNLTTFTSDLSSLTNGEFMLYCSKLDTASVKNIAETINPYNGQIDIGIGRDSATSEEETYFQQIRDKGWNLRVQYNGSSDGSSYSLRPLDENGEETSIPVVYWAKPVPATEDKAHYIDENGNYYNILGGNLIYVDDPETYGMFINCQDAANQMRLTPYIKPFERNR